VPHGLVHGKSRGPSTVGEELGCGNHSVLHQKLKFPLLKQLLILPPEPPAAVVTRNSVANASDAAEMPKASAADAPEAVAGITGAGTTATKTAKLLPPIFGNGAESLQLHQLRPLLPSRRFISRTTKLPQ